MSTLVRGILCCTLATLATGCAHFVESRAIERFADKLREEDLNGLKAASSEDFAEKALRTTSALDDIKILRVPDGKVSIVEVEEVDDNRKRVTVKVGEAKREVFYELVRREEKWVVDDVYLKQKKQGVTAFKSITEQMDLLLSVREFVDAWDGGDRERVLSVTAPKLQASLEKLPPVYLARLTAKIGSGPGKSSGFKPHAQIEDDEAVVKLSRAAGEIVMTLRRVQEAWTVTDVALDTKDDTQKIVSVYKLALSVNACTDFLAAYQRGDKAALESLCDRDFFEGSLKQANLRQVILPGPQLGDHDLDVQLRTQRADFVLRGEREIVQIDIRKEESPEPQAPPTFRVCDVTLYEVETKQEKRLSALFTAQDMLTLFSKALADRDLDHLRHSSTQDFSSRVWQRLNAATVLGLPLEPFDDPTPQVQATTFQGALTRVEAIQGGQPIIYMLRQETGRFFVDDIQWQVPGRPSSVKQTLEALIPMKNFAAAIALGRDPNEQKVVLELLQESCSGDFNRMVWQQTSFVPNGGYSADRFLHAPLRSLSSTDSETIVRLGNDEFGAEIRMRKENQRLVVDDILLIAGPEQSERMALKHALRTVLADGRAVGPTGLDQPRTQPPIVRQKSTIQQAVYEEPADQSSRGQVAFPGSEPIDIGPVTPAAAAFPE